MNTYRPTSLAQDGSYNTGVQSNTFNPTFTPLATAFNPVTNVLPATSSIATPQSLANGAPAQNFNSYDNSAFSRGAPLRPQALIIPSSSAAQYAQSNHAQYNNVEQPQYQTGGQHAFDQQQQLQQQQQQQQQQQLQYQQYQQQQQQQQQQQHQQQQYTQQHFQSAPGSLDPPAATSASSFYQTAATTAPTTAPQLETQTPSYDGSGTYTPTNTEPYSPNLSTPNMRQAQSFTTPGPAPEPSLPGTEASSTRRARTSSKSQPRIDPKQIPRPGNQLEQKVGTEIPKFFTKSGTAPPPANSDYTVVDEGNCSPRFVRMTTGNIAHEQELIESTKLCIGAIIQPLANLGPDEEPIQVVEFPNGPIRCSRCKAYINPHFKFPDAATFICNLCNMKNNVPDEYRCNLDANGFRRDRQDRPELCRGTVEFAVGKEFLLRPVQDPCFLFVIDVSYVAVVTGLVRAAVQGIRVSLDAMAANNRLRVGLVTYDEDIHFYALKPSRDVPEMMVMSDVEDVFVPCPHDEVLVHVSEPKCRELMDSALDMIMTIYDSGKVNNNRPLVAAGAAVSVGIETLKEIGGKVLFFQSGLPTCGVGKLENRENINLYSTDKEKTLFEPANPYYLPLSSQCAESAVTVDIYVCSNAYVDIATMGSLATKTGGQIYLYPGFNGKKDGEALQNDIFHNVTRETGYDGVMVVRTSTGLKINEYYGNYFHRRANEMDLPSVDCDKTFGVRLVHDGKLVDKSESCVQVALLYTTAQGQRRIRVHTISLPVTSVISNIFRYADLDAIINLSLKQGVRQLLNVTTPTEAQEALSNACIDSLFIYRKHCASATSPGQLILPEPLKLLPLSTLGLLKHPLFSYGLHADERSFLFAYVTSMPCYVSPSFVCPRLFSLHNIPSETCVTDREGRVFLPKTLTLSSASLETKGLYLLEDSRHMYLWLGEEIESELLEEVFGSSATESKQVKQNQISRAHADDPYHISSRIRALVAELRKNRPNFLNLQIITRSKETGESVDETTFYSHLVEDGTVVKEAPKGSKREAESKPNTMSYIDFLCFIHHKIQSKFNT